jgi:hypothetical protein
VEARGSLEIPLVEFNFVEFRNFECSCLCSSQPRCFHLILLVFSSSFSQMVVRALTFEITGTLVCMSVPLGKVYGDVRRAPIPAPMISHL